jgi:hypothetical protein
VGPFLLCSLLNGSPTCVRGKTQNNSRARGNKIQTRDRRVVEPKPLNLKTRKQLSPGSPQNGLRRRTSFFQFGKKSLGVCHQEKSAIFTLSREVRDMIWAYALEDYTIHVHLQCGYRRKVTRIIDGETKFISRYCQKPSPDYDLCTSSGTSSQFSSHFATEFHQCRKSRRNLLCLPRACKLMYVPLLNSFSCHHVLNAHHRAQL